MGKNIVIGLRLGDLSDLPDELTSQLRLETVDSLASQIIDIVKNKFDGVASIDEIVVELYRSGARQKQTNEIYGRAFIANKLWRMTKANQLESVKGNKGFYRAVQSNKLTIDAKKDTEMTKSYKFPTTDVEWNEKTKTELIQIEKKANLFGLTSIVDKAKEIRQLKYASSMPLMPEISHPDDLKNREVAEKIRESFRFFFETRSKVEKMQPRRTINMIHTSGYIYAMGRANLALDDKNFQIVKSVNKDSYKHTAEYIFAVEFASFYKTFRTEKFTESVYKKALKNAVEKLTAENLYP